LTQDPENTQNTGLVITNNKNGVNLSTVQALVKVKKDKLLPSSSHPKKGMVRKMGALMRGGVAV
jgi:hypothetical protein